jgi:hypothetical protein
MALCLEYIEVTLCRPGNTLFQAMIKNSMGIFARNIYIPMLYFEIGALTPQVYASSSASQLSKEIQILGPKVALYWHYIATKFLNISELLPFLGRK